MARRAAESRMTSVDRVLEILHFIPLMAVLCLSPVLLSIPNLRAHLLICFQGNPLFISLPRPDSVKSLV